MTYKTIRWAECLTFQTKFQILVGLNLCAFKIACVYKSTISVSECYRCKSIWVPRNISSVHMCTLEFTPTNSPGINSFYGSKIQHLNLCKCQNCSSRHAGICNYKIQAHRWTYSILYMQKCSQVAEEKAQHLNNINILLISCMKQRAI